MRPASYFPSCTCPLDRELNTLFSPADLQSLTQPTSEVWCPTMGSLAFRWLDEFVKLKATCRVLLELETLQACLHRRGDYGQLLLVCRITTRVLHGLCCNLG